MMARLMSVPDAASRSGRPYPDNGARLAARASTHCHAYSPVQPSVAAEPHVARRGAARQWQSKAYVGVGLSLVLAADGAPAVAFAWPGGPAHAAGVSVGDRVVSRCSNCMAQLHARH